MYVNNMGPKARGSVLQLFDLSVCVSHLWEECSVYRSCLTCLNMSNGQWKCQTVCSTHLGRVMFDLSKDV